MWADRRYASRVSGGDDPREPGCARRIAREGLPLFLALLLSPVVSAPVVSAEEIAVRVRDDGRVDVRVTAAPLASVLERVARQTEMSLAYQGAAPTRMVTLAVYASNQAQAVLDLLEGLGVDYAVTLDPTGTRILSLVVADAAPARRADPETNVSSPDALAGEASLPAAVPEPTEPVAEPEAGAGASPAQGFPLLPGDFVPGGRATGQTTEWGMPPFVLPDPQDATTAVDSSPPQPGPSGAPVPPAAAVPGADASPTR
jgi:hypothetical protein